MEKQRVCGGARQPYHNLPVYVVCPIDWEGCSHTLHQNFLLPISHNLGQDECENAVEGYGSNEPTPAPHKEDTLLANSLTKSQPEDTLCLLSEQCKLVDPELIQSTTPHSVDEGLQANDDMPAPLSCKA